MARKKVEAPSGGSAAWISTFADLMNLLLCFFVLLFAFSTVDEEKFEKVTISLSNSIGILDGGGTSIDAGELISSGMLQLNDLDKYLSALGESSSVEGKERQGEADTSKPIETESGNQGSEATQNSEDDQGVDQSNGTVKNENEEINEAMATVEEKMADVTKGMYDEVSDLTDRYNMGDYVDLSINSKSKYVILTLSGSVLFTSGDSELKKDALPILAMVSKILKKFKNSNIEVIGHTDNVPINSSDYKDNNWLSSARALNAAEYLIDECGVDPAKLKCSGRGEYEPISSNSTAEGRAKNRRIEIKIYNEYSSE
ncbi:MAG: flagellar motor protein MotB [Herbinix sp.]|nr:flagellar motor protein MotB [Herbinix sp.]